MSKCKITGKVLVIQLGRQETQLAVIDKGGLILHSATVTTPGGAVEDGMIRNEDAVRGMLKEALKEREFKGVRQTVFALCTSQVIMETVSLPDLPEAKLEKLLLANMDMYFPVDMHDYRVVWEIIGPKINSVGAKEVEVQLWAVPSAMQESYYKVANGCGLSVAALDYCGHSIATAVGASFARKNKVSKPAKKFSLNMELSFGKKASEAASVSEEDFELINADVDMHLTLERDILTLTFVREGQVIFQRLIRCGADPTYQFSEVSMMVEYFRSLEIGRNCEITGIVSGTLSENFAMVSELSDMLDIPLTVLAASYDNRWTVCVGAARTTLDFGNPALNKKSEARRQVQSKLWQYVLLLGAALGLGAVVLFTFAERLSWNSETSKLESEMMILNVQAQKTAGYADNYNAYLSEYNAYSSDWENVFGSLQTYNDNLVLVLDELEDALPENTSVTGLQIAENGLMVDFACETKEEAAYLIMALRRLRYAPLQQISDLQGGGGGAATSFGSNSSEEPPTEGSSDLGSYLDQAKTVNTLYDIAEDEKLAAFTDSDYYKAPAKGKLKGTRTDKEIKAALKEMLVNNPVAGNMFGQALSSEIYSYNPILAHMISADAMKLNNSGAFSGKTRQEQMGVMVDELLAKDASPNKNGVVLYTAHDKLTASEKLIETDQNLLNWYVYYLEKGDAERFPYLDLEKITSDLKKKGEFKTSDADVNDKLATLISADAWDYIESIPTATATPTPTAKPTATPTVKPTATPTVKPTATPTAEPTSKPTTEPTSKPTSEPTTKPTAKPTAEPTAKPTAEPTAKPTTKPTVKPTAKPTSKPTATPAPTDDVSSQIGAMIDTYIESKGKEPAQYKDMIDEYLLTGTTGHPVFSAMLDPKLDEYLDSKQADDKIGELYDAYDAGGDTGIDTVNKVMAQYEEGTLKNLKLMAAIQRYVEKNGGSDQETTLPDQDDDLGIEGVSKSKLKKYVKDFIKDGDTNNNEVDQLLKKYFTTGKSGNTAADKVINSYIDAGNINVEISLLYNTYVISKKTENPTFDKMMKKFDKDGTTGNTKIDRIIEECSDANSGTNEPTGSDLEIETLLNAYLFMGTTSVKTVDEKLEQYFESGKTGITEMDKQLNDYIKNGYLDDEMKLLVDKFIMNNGDSGSAVANELLQRFFMNEFKTGNELVDKVIFKAAGINSGTNDDDYDNLINDLLGGGSEAGGAPEEVDTRIKFTAMLGYNDDLKAAELIRKGLYRENKVKALEEVE